MIMNANSSDLSQFKLCLIAMATHALSLIRTNISNEPVAHRYQVPTLDSCEIPDSTLTKNCTGQLCSLQKVKDLKESASTFKFVNIAKY